MNEECKNVGTLLTSDSPSGQLLYGADPAQDTDAQEKEYKEKNLNECSG